MLERWLFILAIAALAGAPSHAAAPANEGSLSDRIKLLIDRDVPQGLDIEIEVGAIDAGLTLAPCGRMEPFLPPGARLWGRTNVRVRCVEGAAWTVWVPVTVRVYGDALVAARDLPRGKPVAAEDIRIERAELTKLAAGSVLTAEMAIGRLPTRTIAAGELVRADQLKAPAVVAAGDPVRIVLVGDGFQIGADGKALAAAADGQTVAVAVVNAGQPGTRALSGIARPGGIVEVRDNAPSTSLARRR
jgi:flagella basal body P-ring formation protein FlgA